MRTSVQEAWRDCSSVRCPDDHIQRAYRVRVGLFFLFVVIIVAALFLIYQLTQTLHQLNLVESEQDRWRRPDDVIVSLKLKDGDVVAAVGCGAGSFSLKLAPKVTPTTLISPREAFTPYPLRTAITSSRNLWPCWTIRFAHFAHMDDSLSSIVDLGRTRASPVKSRCCNTKSPPR